MSLRTILKEMNAQGHFLVVWDEDSSVSVISGKLMVTPSIVGERTVGSTCTVKTSPRGPPHSARIAGRGTEEEMIHLEERYLSKDYSPFDEDQGAVEQAVRVRDEMESSEEATPPKKKQRRTKGTTKNTGKETAFSTHQRRNKRDCGISIIKVGKSAQKKTHQTNTKQPTVYMDQTSTRQPTVYMDQTSTKQPTVYMDQTSTRQPTVYMDQTSTRQPTVYMDQTSTRQPTVYMDQTSTRQPTVYMDQTITRQPTLYMRQVNAKTTMVLETDFDVSPLPSPFKEIQSIVQEKVTSGSIRDRDYEQLEERVHTLEETQTVMLQCLQRWESLMATNPPLQHPPVTHSAIVLNAQQPPLTPTLQLPPAPSNPTTPHQLPPTPSNTRQLPLTPSIARQPPLTPSNACNRC